MYICICICMRLINTGLKFPTQLIFDEQEIMSQLPKGLQKRMRGPSSRVQNYIYMGGIVYELDIFTLELGIHESTFKGSYTYTHTHT